MNNCVIIFKNERTEFVNKDGNILVTQYEDGEKFVEFTMPPTLAENLKKNLLEDEDAEEKPL